MSAANLPDDVRDLLAAIQDALDVPLPDDWSGDLHRYEALLSSRVGDVRDVVGSALNGAAPGDEARLLRRWTESKPLTYAPYQHTEQQDGAS